MEMGRKMSVVVVVVVLAMVLEGSKALDLCNMNEDGLMACKPAVTEPDPVKPTSECCQAISGANLTCLCSYKNSFMLPSLGIDPDLAMKLPAKCDLTPPTNC